MIETSIIIRTKNEEKWIGLALESVFSQNYKDFEVIIVDSGSTDKTIGIAEKYPAHIVTYAGKYFPGKSMNLGASMAKGKYILFLSAHAIPASQDWLEKLVRDFQDERVAAVYGKQIPGPDCDPYQKIFFYGIFDNKKRVQTDSWWFSAVNCAIRRKLWEKIKFDETIPMREDSIWAKKIIQTGFSIIYEPEAVVVHTHHDNYQKVFCKAYNTYYSLRIADENFKFSLIKEFRDLFYSLKLAFGLFVKSQMNIFWFIKIIIFWLSRTVGFYFGYKRAMREKTARKFGLV